MDKNIFYPVMFKEISVPYVIDKELEFSFSSVKVVLDIFIQVNRASCLLSFTIGFINSRLSPGFENVISNSEM